MVKVSGTRHDARWQWLQTAVPDEIRDSVCTCGHVNSYVNTDRNMSCCSTCLKPAWPNRSYVRYCMWCGLWYVVAVYDPAKHGWRDPEGECGDCNPEFGG